MNERVGQYLELWLATLHVERRTIDNYRADVRTYLNWAEDVGIAALEAVPGDILAFKASLQAKGLALRTVTRRMQILDMFYRWLEASGHVTHRPTATLTHAPHPPVVGERLSLEEFQAIWAVSAPDALDRAVTGLLGVCCLTIDEVSRADVPHLSFREGHTVLRLPRRTPVVPGAEFVPLPPEVAEAVQSARGDRTAGPLLVNTWGNRLEGTAVRRVVMRLASKAGIIRQVHARMLTNTGRWLAVDQGFSVAAAMTLMPTLDGRRLKPYLDTASVPFSQHPSYRIERFVRTDVNETERGLEQAEILLYESAATPPAAAVAIAAAVLERHLRALTRACGRTVDEDNADLGTYSGQLRGAGVINNDEVQLLARLQSRRNDAAHGWFERFERGDAEEFIREARRLVYAHPLT